MDDRSTFDNNFIPLAQISKSSRSRRSRKNVSYKIDDSELDGSDKESEDESGANENNGLQIELPGNGTSDFSRGSVKKQVSQHFGNTEHHMLKSILNTSRFFHQFQL